MKQGTSQKVAVVGAGSVGGFFAAQAGIAGHQVTLCVRTPFEHLVVVTGGEEVVVDAAISTEPGEVGVHDWVFLAVKAHQTQSASGWLGALCGPETVVVVMQNGVEHRERVEPLVGESHVLPAVVRYGGEALEPGVVRHYTYGSLVVPDDHAGRRLVELLRSSDAEVRLTDDFAAEAWSKLVTNVAANALPAITMQRFPIFRRPDVAELAEGLMAETIAVAAAVGVGLDPELARSEVDRLAGLPDHVGSSMLYDRLSGRPLEHDALNGAVVRIGSRHGVPAPLNQVMMALLAAISDGAGT